MKAIIAITNKLLVWSQSGPVSLTNCSRHAQKQDNGKKTCRDVSMLHHVNIVALSCVGTYNFRSFDLFLVVAILSLIFDLLV